MTCQTVEPELVAYHFGTCEPAVRSEIEAHLLACPACVRAFVTLKRNIESADDGPLPSEAARLELRAAVRAALNAPSRPWSWWERPLAFGVAGATVVVAVLAVYTASISAGHPPRALSAAEGIDRPAPP